ncbi:DUF5074 domain-containing protein [Soonwooa sp.]|uniref:DUF5074 domain-containing protein n=1 Tax=Soonwooa sp. TaxID=1938592 RepID=UPI00262CDD4B|nr:DUF5074 domain-containing protein [Soonwooa sp.]
MRKMYLFFLLFLFAFSTNAQVTVQGVPRSEVKNITQKKQAKKNGFTMDDVVYWVGTGSKKAVLAVQWNDEKNPDALVWGFRWDGEATGEEMVKAIAKVDKRFYTLLYQGTQYGSAIAGIGFDLDGKGTVGLYKNNNTTYPLYPLDGIVNTTEYDFDKYKAIDANDHWQSGWYQGYWSYWVKDTAEDDYGYSGVGATGRQLVDGSWDLWNYNVDMMPQDIATTFTPVSVYSAQADFTKGFFMVNEEWFGHTNGSVNFVGNNDQIYYRVYSEKNNNEAFGATTQYGTIYGDKFYFISKQQKDGGDTQYGAGGRLVVANAKTMEKIAGFDSIGGGDGRSFVGIDQNTGYIAASNGVYLFDIANMKVGDLIVGTGGGATYSGQIGNMIRTSQYVFAVKQTTGVLVIDPKTHTLKTTIAGAFHSIVQAKDGSVWAIQDKKLININPTTFATTEYPIPTTKYIGAWGAWNAGSFTASTQQNALYWINSISDWASGTQVVKFDVTNKTFNENFSAIPGQTGTYKQIPYGAALRVDPVSDKLILNTTESGYGAHYQKNWIHTIDTTGAVVKTQTLNDYYWFPAVTVFPDVFDPVVSPSLPDSLTINGVTKIDLKNKVIDQDNLSAGVVASIKSLNKNPFISAEINENDELVITPIMSGTSSLVLSFNSNGKVVDHTMTIASATLATDNVSKVDLQVYPNPAVDFVSLKSSDKVTNVEVYDFSGKRIALPFVDNQLDVRSLAKGVYVVKVTTDKASYQRKLVKN